MSYTSYKTVNFGKPKSGLSTVGYTVAGTRSTSGVSEVVTGSGIYGASLTFAAAGPLVWDTGETTPSYASDELVPPVAGALPADGLDAVVVETGVNARQALSLTVAALAGVVAGAATTGPISVKAAGDAATERISAACDSNGNRTAVTLHPPA